MTDRRSTRAAARRSRTTAQVAEQAERGFRDTRLDPLRPLARRRAVIVTWSVLVVGAAVTVALAGPLVDLLAIAVAATATWLVRALVRTIADLPDEVLDERLVVRRDSGYRVAYQFLAGVTSLLLVVLYIVGDAARLDVTITPDHLSGALWLVILLAMGMPSAAFGWAEPEV